MRWLIAFVLLLAACGDNLAGEDRQGGDTTTDDRTALAFRQPAANLTADQVALFQAGTGPFDFHWEIPQLGPLFNNDACFGCHFENGRGLSQIGDDGTIGLFGPVSDALVRVSLDEGSGGDPGGPIPVPGFGTQLQDHAVNRLPEVNVTLTWRELPGNAYGDGTLYSLRSPVLDIRTPDGNPLADGIHQSYRTAPPLIGMGLLNAIDAATLEALADPDDANGDGISGRINHVWDPVTQTAEIGRFGWKANVATLRLQVAGAAANDMGLSNEVFPDPDGNRDVPDAQLDQMVAMVSTIGVPREAPRSAAAWHGRELFDQFHCSGCHIPTLETGDDPNPALAHQIIHPYTDLLLHDMGDELSDARSDFQASGTEWRTPPLWGIGLTKKVQPGATFLHDGRARTLAEAILWHGGEAEAAREAFRTASKADRDALIAFLSTL